MQLSVLSPCVLCFSYLMFPRGNIWLVPVPVLVLCDYCLVSPSLVLIRFQVCRLSSCLFIVCSAPCFLTAVKVMCDVFLCSSVGFSGDCGIKENIFEVSPHLLRSMRIVTEQPSEQPSRFFVLKVCCFLHFFSTMSPPSVAHPVCPPFVGDRCRRPRLTLVCRSLEIVAINSKSTVIK